MTAVPILIADAVAAEINTAGDGEVIDTFGMVAKRTYADWDDCFEDLSDGGAALDVVFRSAGKISLNSFGSLLHEPSIHVAIRKRFEPSDREDDGRLKQSSVDPLVSLLEEIYEHFATRRNSVSLPGETNATWEGEDSVIRSVDQAKLRQGLFEGYVEIRFQYDKEV